MFRNCRATFRQSHPWAARSDFLISIVDTSYTCSNWLGVSTEGLVVPRDGLLQLKQTIDTWIVGPTTFLHGRVAEDHVCSLLTWPFTDVT